MGSALGTTEGIAVVGRRVGLELGDWLGTGVALKVGAAVGEYVTRDTPAPAITALPVHAVEPVQPSRMMYVCDGVPAGTVYCTCAQTLDPEMHADGGRSPVPVSSYTTSTPAAEYTRSVVDPVQLAPVNSAPHIDIVNVCPALAVTPHTGTLVVSVLVWLAV